MWTSQVYGHHDKKKLKQKIENKQQQQQKFLLKFGFKLN